MPMELLEKVQIGKLTLQSQKPCQSHPRTREVATDLGIGRSGFGWDRSKVATVKGRTEHVLQAVGTNVEVFATVKCVPILMT